MTDVGISRHPLNAISKEAVAKNAILLYRVYRVIEIIPRILEVPNCFWNVVGGVAPRVIHRDQNVIDASAVHIPGENNSGRIDFLK